MSRYEDEEERKILDIIIEPLYLSFHRHPILSHIKRNPFHIIHGPVINEREEYEYCLNEARSFCAGTSISTYPLKKNIQISRDSEEENPPEQVREGSPICDQYRSEFFHTRAIVCIADGCNWGDPPREAARAARDAFVQYLRKHHTEIQDVQVAGALILRAFSIANHAIMREKTPGIQKVGTTTLLGGILVQLEQSDHQDNNNNINNNNDNTETNNELTDLSMNGGNHSWGFIYGSVGDCKAVHWSVKTKKFTDITLNNRLFTTNATDSGGRLGPYLPGDLPDLRNFELGFLPCDEGDYLLLLSDGIHDNFDIAFLGKKPRDYDIDSDDWDHLPDPKAAEEIKNIYRLKKLEEVIFANGEEKSKEENNENNNSNNIISSRESLPPPIDIVRNLMLYCRDICKPAANWMQQNPNRRLPKDFNLYPGKMDHTTCVCIVVKEQTEENELSFDSD